MKRVYSFIFFVALSFGIFGCIKNDPPTFTQSVVEFDASTYNANTGYTPQPDSIAFPIMVRTPVPGVASSTANSAVITRTSGSISLRINLVGPQRSTPTEVKYTVITDYKVLGTPPAGLSAAVAGTHYAALPGTLTIPANSSFGTLDIQILNPGPGTGSRDLILKLVESKDVKPNRNYSVVGIRIAQT